MTEFAFHFQHRRLLHGYFPPSSSHSRRVKQIVLLACGRMVLIWKRSLACCQEAWEEHQGEVPRSSLMANAIAPKLHLPHLELDMVRSDARIVKISAEVEQLATIFQKLWS